MARIVKAPDDRKREILDTAMALFMERGYESTSLRDIAKRMAVTPGLVYHYFDSKQKLFDQAMDLYVEECAADYIRVLRSTDLGFLQKLDVLFQTVQAEQSLRYHDFFHAQGNEGLHLQLALRLTACLQPHLVDALRQAGEREGLRVKDPETFVSFISHGQMGIFSERDMPREKALDRIREYIVVLLESQVVRT